MAKRGGGAGKKAGKLSGRETIMILVITVLVIALLVSLFAGDKLGLLLNKEPASEPDKTVYTSVLSGKGNVVLPPEIDGDNCLEVHFINIGQGDAIVCMLPDGKNLLLDAGSGTNVSNAIRTAYRKYLSDNLNLNKVDYMVISHPDSDHVNMASEVLDNYDVDNIYYNEFEEDGSNVYRTFMQKARTEEGAELFEIEAESEVLEINGDNYKLTIYAPGNRGFEGAESVKNSMSLICVLEYGDRRIIFTGDAEVETEEWFISKAGGEELDTDVLKVGHHGSKSCTSSAFLDFIKPEYAVISCDGGSAYGHPHATTMNTLYNYGVVTYRTNRHGSIVLYVDNDGDFGFLTEINAPVENNKLELNPMTILLETLSAA